MPSTPSPIPSTPTSAAPSRTVREALTPSPKRPRLQLARCPICATRLPFHTINTHLDRCRARAHPILHLSLQSSGAITLARENQPPNIPHHTFHQTIRLTHPIRNASVLHVSAPLASDHIPILKGGSVAVLKSALQKCVRRKRPFPAVRVAVVLIRRLGSVFQLLRRFTIIVLEDAILHPKYPLLVAFMCLSSKGYHLDRRFILLILQVVYDVAAGEYRDSRLEKEQPEQMPVVEEPYRTLITSLQIRATYGGMLFDTALLQRAISLWSNRLGQPSWQQHLQSLYPTNPLTLDMLERWMNDDSPLGIGDIPLESLDFHCSPVIEWLHSQLSNGAIKAPLFDKYSAHADRKKCLKDLMWKFRSGVNCKTDFVNHVNEPAADGDMPPEVAQVPDALEHEQRQIWKTELAAPITEWSVKFRRRYLQQ